MIYSLIVFLPLIAFLLAGLFGRWIGDRGAQVVTCVAVSVAALLAWIGFFSVIWGDGPTKVMLFTWITSGDFDVAWSLRIDQLTAVMLVVVTTVSALVHIYSVGYMAHDPGIPRFMAYLSFFTFAMLALIRPFSK